MSLFFPRFNLAVKTDSYKVTHWKQYPKDTEYLYDYLEARGGRFDRTLVCGLQSILKKFLLGQVITEEKIARAEKRWAKHFGNASYFNAAGWRYILETHGGKLPIEIRALPEGMVVPTGTPLMTVVNTDPKCGWLVGWLEPILMKVWYPITVATQSWQIKQMLRRYLQETGDVGGLNFMLHDFGDRGVSSEESAEIGTFAHLINFFGSDTPGSDFIEDFYGIEGIDILDTSVAAAEHSTVTTWGGPAHELEAYSNLLDEFPEGILSVVSDSYNIFNACSNLWGEKLRARVLNRNGVLVVRPDSGKPSEVVLEVLERLGEKFPVSINPKGYKVLDPHVRVIQGDGVNYNSIKEILETLKRHGWSASNLVFGMGGALLQIVNRDDQKFAIKCSSICRSSSWYDVYKDPITDQGKRSKVGRFSVIEERGTYKTLPEGHPSDLLETVYLNGELIKEYTFAEIRSRAEEAAKAFSS